MRWNKMIQNEPSEHKSKSPIEKFNTSRSRISIISNNNNANSLTLKSCEKLKEVEPVTLLRKITSVGEHNENEESQKKTLSKKSSCGQTQIDKLNKVMSCFGRQGEANGQIEQIVKLMESLHCELEFIAKRYLGKFEQIIQNKLSREDFGKKVLQQMELVIANSINQVQPLLLRANTNFTLGNYGSAVKTDRSPLQQLSQKKKTRAVNFKNEKVNQKNSFNKIENSVIEINRLLDNGKRQPKFIRTNRSRRLDRSVDSSVDDILEKSMQASQNSYRNKINTKETFYNFNKILNE